MHDHRTIGPVLMVSVMVAAFVLASGVSGESPPQGGSPPIERRYKGQLDPVGPFSWLDLDGVVRASRSSLKCRDSLTRFVAIHRSRS